PCPEVYRSCRRSPSTCEAQKNLVLEQARGILILREWRYANQQAAITSLGGSPPGHRRPQLRHSNTSTEKPVCRSMVVSGLRLPSHIQHRRLSPSTSATFSYGIVVLLRQALELLIQEDEGISRHSRGERLLCLAVLKRDFSAA